MALDGGRIGIASQAIGIATASLEEAAAYARERKQFGKSIGDYQAIQWMIADSKTELEAARLLTLRAAQMKESGVPFSREAAMAKLFASEAAGRICDRGVQIHGGYGYVRDFPAERHLRDVRVTRIYEGTSEIQRTVIARSSLA
jgi:alkylation response protein AidB-like acyl-CoA dehydrogenase